MSLAPITKQTKLGIISYDYQHLKTEQVMLSLHARGFESLTLYTLPFAPRAEREILFQHRPDMSTGAHTRALAGALGAQFVACAGADQIPTDDVDLFLVAGAGILPASFVSATRGRVLNIHPGIIPLVRGLDAFKWAIVDGMPMGVTMHTIDEEADAGEVLSIVETPLFETDTLESFAQRHYEIEIMMTVNFDEFVSSAADQASYEVRPARMRMPLAVQEQLRPAFEEYKTRFAAGPK
jgi:phosphoribosylglycinamide formyltransferase-1